LLHHLAAPSDLKLAIIETFLIIFYFAMKGNKIGEVSLDPTVCLNDFEDEDPIDGDELDELEREREDLPCLDLQME